MKRIKMVFAGLVACVALLVAVLPGTAAVDNEATCRWLTGYGGGITWEGSSGSPGGHVNCYWSDIWGEWTTHHHIM